MRMRGQLGLNSVPEFEGKSCGFRCFGLRRLRVQGTFKSSDSGVRTCFFPDLGSYW